MTRVPGNKDHHLLSADRGKQIWIGGLPDLPALWQFCCIPGWAHKKSQKSE